MSAVGCNPCCAVLLRGQPLAQIISQALCIGDPHCTEENDCVVLLTQGLIIGWTDRPTGRLDLIPSSLQTMVRKTLEHSFRHGWSVCRGHLPGEVYFGRAVMERCMMATPLPLHFRKANFSLSEVHHNLQQTRVVPLGEICPSVRGEIKVRSMRVLGSLVPPVYNPGSSVSVNKISFTASTHMQCFFKAFSSHWMCHLRVSGFTSGLECLFCATVMRFDIKYLQMYHHPVAIRHYSELRKQVTQSRL